MGVPFEALIPAAIIVAVCHPFVPVFDPVVLILEQMYGITGGGLSTLRYYQNEHKRGRHSVDQWDRVSITTCNLILHAKANTVSFF